MAFPPSYELATARDAWAIVAPCIPSADLCAASLVSRRWHEMFVPFLWGAPASHFGTDNDAVYVALTRFRRTLKRSRLWVRELTHTLHLPPALSEIYDGPRRTWLQEVLEYLPRLQSLLVSELPFFDHSALVTLGQGAAGAAATAGQDGATYNLRLLLAQREPNTTSVGLWEAILHFPKLVYLDLSYTTPARDHGVLSALSELPDLQVLKLRAIGLRDGDVEVLTNAIRTRVRFLDLRNNQLTDSALRTLMQACFMPSHMVSDGQAGIGGAQFEWRISTAPIASPLVPESFTSEHLDDHFLQQLTVPMDGRSMLEDLPHVGITHLYVADNNLSVEGLVGLLKLRRLHLLDGGTVDTAESIRKRQYLRGDTQFVKTVRFPGAEKLVPILCHEATDNVTYLRIHHAVVTEDGPTQKELSLASLLPELPADSAGPGEHGAELDAGPNQMHELPAGPIPVFELADTSISHTSIAAREPPMRQEVDLGPPSPENDSPARSATDDLLSPISAISRPPDVQTLSVTTSYSDLPETVSPTNPPPSPSHFRDGLIQELIAKRPKNAALPQRDSGQTNYPFLHPSNLPHLRTLVLTDVPSSIPASSTTLTSLKRFISACADEALLASLQARSDYSLPPGWYRANAELRHAKSLFALEKLILEITPVAKANSTKSWQPSSHLSTGQLMSSTGDRDSENLWSSAQHDFSFFGNEECGIPDNEPERYFPMSELNQKVVLSPEDEESPTHSTSNGIKSNSSRPSSTAIPSRLAQPTEHRSGGVAIPTEADIDLISELASFRKSKRAQYEELIYREHIRRRADDPLRASSPSLPQSPMPPHVEGHWKGEVQIVRNHEPKGRSGMVDLFGNYFEKGYLYP